MKSSITVTLDSKEVRIIIAKALNIPISAVKPLRYNFAIEGYSEEEVSERLKAVGAYFEDN